VTELRKLTGTSCSTGEDVRAIATSLTSSKPLTQADVSAAYVVEVVGLELSPPHGLLRSLVVEPRARSGGLGSRLLAHAEAHARSRDVRSLYLLTTTAEAFFGARGYVRADRREAPPFIRSSPEFTALCPESAAFMVKHLPE